MYGVTKIETIKNGVFTTARKNRKIDVTLKCRKISRMCFGCDKTEDVIEYLTTFGDCSSDVFKTLEAADKHFCDLLEQ
jgi:hypothetical protein